MKVKTTISPKKKRKEICLTIMTYTIGFFEKARVKPLVSELMSFNTKCLNLHSSNLINTYYLVQGIYRKCDTWSLFTNYLSDIKK